MCRITCSLIPDGLKTNDALLACKGFMKYPTKIPKKETIYALEKEAALTPPIPEYIREALESVENPLLPPIGITEKPQRHLKKTVRRKRNKKPQFRQDDFPAPWCKVFNKDGILIRYEDSNGRPIPDALWAEVR